MTKLRSSRRSVSPFGFKPVEKDYFDILADDIQARCPDLKPQEVSFPSLFQDFYSVPGIMRQIAQAPANDAPQLNPLCDYLLKHTFEMTSAGLFDAIFNSMKYIFNRKTDLFMVDHHDREHCEKMGWKEEYRDTVLFSAERDILAGRFFDPVTKDSPGHFSEFIRQWSETDNWDRALHFLDFCAKLSHSTFEFYLLGHHAALSRLTHNKDFLRSIFQRCQPLLKKIKSPTWERDSRRALGV